MTLSRRRLLFTAPIFAGPLLAGCAATPSHYYRLAPIPGAVFAGLDLKIGVRSISIPGYLDRDSIAKNSLGYAYSSFANDLWAEPLDNLLQSVMVQNLAQRLPTSTVLGSGGAIGAPSSILLEINILRFDPDASGTITLMAQIAIKSGDDQSVWQTQTFTNTETARPGAAGADAAGIVIAMSQLWASAADQIAGSLAHSGAAAP